MPKKTEEDMHRFEEGDIIGNLAKQLFKGGVDAQVEDKFIESIEKTKKLLKERKTLFEPSFMSGPLFARADIMEPVENGEWDLTEVKSSTQVKEDHVYDVAFQKICYEASGLKLRKCFLMHINNEFVKKGKINPKKLFTRDDITEDVDNKLSEVMKDIQILLKVISSKTCPKNAPNNIICQNMYDCELATECWDFLPEHSVFDLCGSKKKAIELMVSGVLALKDIPEEYELNEKQMIQHGCSKTRKEHIHKDALKRFLAKLKYPLYYLDFETFGTGVPIHDGTRPYQQIPFQFSVHVVEKRGQKPKHYSYITEGKQDPRKEFAEQLIKVLGNKGSIIIYNQGFEQRIIEALAEFLPKHHDKLLSYRERMIDLLQPFKDFNYYNPKQGGSASLKEVLPALTGKNYDKLEIAKGGTASLAFLHITYGSDSEKPSKAEIKKVRANLEKYCGLDTEGLIWIIDKLRKISK
jgi:hypothetical protein